MRQALIKKYLINLCNYIDQDEQVRMTFQRYYHEISDYLKSQAEQRDPVSQELINYNTKLQIKEGITL